MVLLKLSIYLVEVNMFSGKTKPRYVVVQVGEYYFVKDMKGTVLGSLYAELSYQGVAKGWWTTQNRDKYA